MQIFDRFVAEMVVLFVVNAEDHQELLNHAQIVMVMVLAQEKQHNELFLKSVQSVEPRFL